MAKGRTFRQLVRQVWDLLPESIRKAEVKAAGRPFSLKDGCFTMYSFCKYSHCGVTMMQLDSGKLEIADGDPDCNWCFNTFSKEYPADIDAAIIARRIVRELRKQRKLKESAKLWRGKKRVLCPT